MPGPGIYPVQLGAVSTTLQYGGIPFLLWKQTVAGTATYNLPDPNGFVGITPFAVIRVGGVMTGAGGVGDTVQLQDEDGNAITEAIDLSALTTDDVFACATIDLTYSYIAKNAGLRVVTASGALCLLTIECVRVEV